MWVSWWVLGFSCALVGSGFDSMFDSSMIIAKSMQP
eukprot:COSAG02_NODE_28179_length_594_cov_1.713131_1_plen_35_part_01